MKWRKGKKAGFRCRCLLEQNGTENVFNLHLASKLLLDLWRFNVKVCLSFPRLTFTFISMFSHTLSTSFPLCVCVRVFVWLWVFVYVYLWDTHTRTEREREREREREKENICALKSLPPQCIDFKYTHLFAKVFSSIPFSRLKSKSKPCSLPHLSLTLNLLYIFLRSWRMLNEKWNKLGQ